MSDDDKPKMWIVHWEYGDKSAHGFVKVFDSEAEARELYELMKAHAETKTWYIDQIDASNNYD